MVILGGSDGEVKRGEGAFAGRAPFTGRMSAMTRACAPLLPVLGLALGVPAARATPGIEGDYDSPLGRVHISTDAAGYRGRLAAPSALCGFQPGDEVLRATLLDDSLAGEMRVCLSGKTCRRKEAWGSAVLLAGDGKLSGAIHVSERGCVGPFGRTGGVTLARVSSSPPPAPVAASAGARRERARAAPPGRQGLPRRGGLRAGAAALPRGHRGGSRRARGLQRRRRHLADAERPRRGARAGTRRRSPSTRTSGTPTTTWPASTPSRAGGSSRCATSQIAALNGYATAEGIDADPDLEPLRGLARYRRAPRGTLTPWGPRDRRLRPSRPSWARGAWPRSTGREWCRGRARDRPWR